MNPTTAPRRTPTKPAGWIYLIHTRDDPTMYVGQTTTPVWSRVNAHRKRQPWGGRIKPGRDGYTILRRVESLGDPTLNAIALDLAEAEEIARWHPSDNANRPDPEVFRARLERAMVNPTDFTPRPRRWARTGPLNGRAVASEAWGRGVPWRVVGFALLSAAWVVLVGRVAGAMPNPTAPWVAIPMAAVLGPAVTVGLYRYATRPRRRRRTYRRRGRRR